MIHPKIMRYKDLDLLYKHEYSQLKIKVALNWFEFLSLIVVTLLIALKIFFWLKIGHLSINIALTLLISFTITYLFSHFRRYQLTITRFDKEDLYKSICRKLIHKSKNSH
jgi:hypothetical protein